jgi:hypothetical protein
MTEVEDRAILQEHVDLIDIRLGGKRQLLQGTLELAVILSNWAMDLLDHTARRTLGAVLVSLQLGEFLGIHYGNGSLVEICLHRKRVQEER